MSRNLQFYYQCPSGFSPWSVASSLTLDWAGLTLASAAHPRRAGVSVSTVTRSAIAINPEGEAAEALRGWWDATGCTAALSHAGEGLASAIKCAPRSSCVVTCPQQAYHQQAP